MKEKKVTKKAIFASLLSVAVCTSMLIGTSYAWFTDSVTSSGNIIKSGTLDIALSYADSKVNPQADNATWEDATDKAIFTYDNWEPGYVDVKHVKISNEGTLALKYQFAIQANGELEVNDEGHTLADAIDVYYFDPAVEIADRAAFDALVAADNPVYQKMSLADAMGGIETTGEGKLYAKDDADAPGNSEEKVTIVLKMREDAGNEYQGMELGSSFSVQVLATQWTYEEDTFNNQYDAQANGEPDNAVFPVIAVSTRPEFLDALNDAEDGDVIDLGGRNVYLLANTDVDKEVTISNAVFDTTDITGNVNLYKVNFNKPVTFKDCKFNSELGIYTTTFKGGVTFENCTFDGDDNQAFYNNFTDGDVTFKNCNITAKWCYAININGGSAGHTLTIDNCNVAGWVSFSSPTLTKIVMKDSTFTGEYAPGEACAYKRVRFYQDAEVTNCTFTDSYEAIDACADNITIAFKNCTGLAGKFDYYGTRTGVTWTVDGTDVTNDATYFVANP